MEAVAIQLPKIKLTKQDIVFDGGAGDYPWALCMKEKWVIEHTVIDGKRLKF